jgi:2-dehydropantoate 2-reductase
MRIAIVGPGALGCLFGAFLGRAGHVVTLVGRNEEKARLLRREGIKLWEGDRLSRVPVEATVSPPQAGGVAPSDLVLILVKAYDTEKAAETALPFLGPETPVLTLQNGLGPADLLAGRLGAPRILAGVTAQGATQLAPGEVRHGGNGPTLLGYHASPAAAPREDIVAAFNGAGLSTRWESDIVKTIWKKLAVSCGINALTALTGIRNGVVAEHPDARALCADAVRETARVAAALGIDLGDPGELAAWVESVARATAINRSSMGQDVDHRRHTEVGFINGAVARLADVHGLDAPVNRTLARLVTTLETGFTRNTK